MKRFTTYVVILGFFCGLVHCLPPRAFAEEKPITSSLGNPKIKLIGEMTLPSAINKIVFEKGKDGKTCISNILTRDGYYAVDEKSALTCLLDLNQWKTDDGTWVFEESVSHDGQYAIASFWPQKDFVSQSIVNLKTLEKTPIKQEGRGWPAFSSKSVMFMDAMGRSTYFADFQGNILNHYKLRNNVNIGKGHQFGFFGASPASFYDQSGEILKVLTRINLTEFRVNYDTGQIAMYYCVYDESGKPKESKVGIYNWKGELQSEMILPFDPNVDLGFSADSRYVVVGSNSGWVTLLDMQNEQELWKKNVKVGKAFYWHMPFPIADNAKFLALYTIEEKSNKFMITIFNREGGIVGYIEVNLRRNMEETRLDFIPDTSDLVFHSGNYLSIFRIED